MRQLPILVGLGASAIAVVGNPEIEDEVPRPSRVLEVVDNLDVAALLSRRVTGRDAELCAHLMSCLRLREPPHACMASFSVF